MGCNDIIGLPCRAFRIRFADADDGNKARRMGSFGLGQHLLAGFPVVLATLGVPQDDIGAAEVLQHGGGDIAREGPGRLRMAVLPAPFDGRLLQKPPHRGDQGRRWT